MTRNMDHVLEPARFFGDPVLLSGAAPELLPEGVEVVTDIGRAMLLENGQDLPEGYEIWQFSYGYFRSKYFSKPEADEGRALVEADGDGRDSDIEQLDGAALETEFYEFWDTVAGEIINHLESISVSRFVLGDDTPKFLEDMFQVYRAGFYPCGLRKDGGMVAFDPKALGGFDLVEAARRKSNG